MLLDAAGNRLRGRQAVLAMAIRSMPPPLPNPETHHQRIVYICQGEYGVASRDDDVQMTTSDATTCIVLALHCSDTGITAMAHMDSHDIDLQPIIRGMQRPTAYMAGAFDAASRPALDALLAALDAAPQPVILKLASVDTCNTDNQGCPIVTALTIDAPTGTVWQGVQPSAH